jgi:hypothetical protein
MVAGRVVITGGAGGTFRTGGAPGFARLLLTVTLGAVGFVRLSSLELQLEMPNAAMSDSTTTVEAIRAGVHKDF